MKIAASILLFYFSFLVMQPALTAFIPHEQKCTMSCCHKTAKREHNAPSGNCCTGMMNNPMGQYSCCTGYVIEHGVNAPHCAQMENQSIPANGNHLISGFYKSCWHPPEYTLS
jgi:hypothetical protein